MEATTDYAESMAKEFQAGNFSLEYAVKALADKGFDRRDALRFLIDYKERPEGWQ